MLWTLAVVLLLIWMFGLVLHLGGALIHLLLVAAIVVFVVHLITGARRVT